MKIQQIVPMITLLALIACNSNTADTESYAETESTDTAGMATISGTAADTGINVHAGPATDVDKEFVKEAAASGNTEVLAAQIALNTSSNQRVKDYANMMIADHSKANEELKKMAAQKNMMLPDSVMAKQHDELASLRKLSASNFDKMYMTMMVTDHEATVRNFENATQRLDDAELRAWASKTLPHLRMHLDSARALQKQLK